MNAHFYANNVIVVDDDECDHRGNISWWVMNIDAVCMHETINKTAVAKKKKKNNKSWVKTNYWNVVVNYANMSKISIFSVNYIQFANGIITHEKHKNHKNVKMMNKVLKQKYL